MNRFWTTPAAVCAPERNRLARAGRKSGSVKTYHVCLAFHAECCTDAHLCFQSVAARSFEDAAKEARRRAEKSGWTVGDIAEVKFCRF